ncbi:hypothetical protein [Brevundimonas sp.]|uniref:ImuA family protein n=1 Tax=Brevundimonas sp. TaxID=1871086 RepID=UPI0025C62036|nr:hypothetical protein [Brevundimonas sp.]
MAAFEGYCGRLCDHAGDDGPLASLSRQALHDLYAASPADAMAGNAVGLGMAIEAAAERPVVWALHEMAAQEAGRPYAPGLNEMGLLPQNLLLVRVRDIQTLLAVGEEALRNQAVGAVLLSAWGEARAMNLTASRRLALAARSGGATVFLARAAAEPAPSAAETRWSVRAVASAPLERDAPGRPAFSATRLRHRGGGVPRTWTLEWDREHRVFVEPAPLSGGLVSLAAERPAGARDTDIVRCIV